MAIRRASPPAPGASHLRTVALALCCGAFAAPLQANDSAAVLSAGGLEFVAIDDIAMESEDLYISSEAIRVTYRFRNDGPENRKVLVAFPLPDIVPEFYAPIAWPQGPDDNLFDFETRFDGEPIASQWQTYAFAAGVDRGPLLRELGIPLNPMGEAAQRALDALAPEKARLLYDLGVIVPQNFEFPLEGETSWWPSWTLKSAYTWEAVFPAGRSVTVEHRYVPSAGGSAGSYFLSVDEELARYRRQYCLDDGLVSAVRRSVKADDPYSAPFTETWLSYILTTGRNWAGPIERFRLVVDKGRAENLVSFCWDGPVKKIGPTQFEATAENFYPTGELQVLILNRTGE